MKIVLLFISVFLTSTFALPAEKKLSKPNENQEKVVKQAGVCKVNICYALDGSGSINTIKFQRQQAFAMHMASFISADDPDEENTRFAAVQYGSSIESVSPLTISKLFFLKVLWMEQLQGKRTYISGGIHYCADLLYPRKGEVNGIVLFTNGKAPFGGDPAVAANRFRNEGGEMLVVSIGSSDTQRLVDIAGGDPKKVLSVDARGGSVKFANYFLRVAAKNCKAGSA